MEAISTSDKVLIDQLRKNLANDLTEFYDTDFNLLRWLTGLNREMKKIEPMLRSHLRLRKMLNLDCPTADLPVNQFVDYYYPCYICKEPSAIQDNLVIILLPDGKVDIKGLCHSVSSTDVLLAKLYATEKVFRTLMEKERQTGKQHFLYVIYDAGGVKFDYWTLRQCRGFIPSCSQFLCQHYVEMTQKHVCFNVTWFAASIWKWLKPLLPREVASRINILGKDWEGELSKDISHERLPVCYGGNNEFEFENAPSKVATDPSDFIIPESLYYNADKDPRLQFLTPLTIARNSTHTITKEITNVPENNPNSVTWLLRIHSNVGFALFFTDTLVPVERLEKPISETMDCDEYSVPFPAFNLSEAIVPDEGRMKADKPGFYHFQFTNESRLFTTSLDYSIAIESTDAKVQDSA